MSLKGTTGKNEKKKISKIEMTNIIQGGFHGLAARGVVWEDTGAEQGCAASSVWIEVESVRKAL